MACSTVVPKKWRDDTKDNCALTDASIRQAHKVGGGTRVMMGDDDDDDIDENLDDDGDGDDG